MNEKTTSIATTTDAFELAQRVAKGFAASDLVPKQYQGNVPNVLIAMEIANRTGAGVFAIMQNMNIIQGRPGWSSSYLIATVNASGKFSPLRFRFEGEPGTPAWGCRAYAKDMASGEECQGPLVTLAIAKAEGWLDKSGSKWKTMPELMLHYRSAAFWTRIFAPELSLGMHISEEVADAGLGYGSAEVIPDAPGSALEKLTARLIPKETPEVATEKEPEKTDATAPEPEKPKRKYTRRTAVPEVPATPEADPVLPGHAALPIDPKSAIVPPAPATSPATEVDFHAHVPADMCDDLIAMAKDLWGDGEYLPKLNAAIRAAGLPSGKLTTDQVSHMIDYLIGVREEAGI